MLSESLKRYLLGIIELDFLIAKGMGDSDNADLIRAELDDVVNNLSLQDYKIADELSIGIAELREKYFPTFV